jgi:hypothetical protein
MISESERRVMNHLNKDFYIQLTKIPESGPTSPDFELIVNGRRAFVLEHMDIENVPVCEKTGWKVTGHPSGIQEAERKNNSVSRIAEKIAKAAKQLRQYRESKGVVFINHDRRVRINHLHELYDGYRIYTNGTIAYKNVAAQRINKGRFREIRDAVDFFIWIDFREGSIDNRYFRHATKVGEEILINYFKAPVQVDPIRPPK